MVPAPVITSSAVSQGAELSAEEQRDSRFFLINVLK